MNILSVESSCDETAVAIVRDGREILTDCIASQVEIHKLYGGVVPEIASRKHIEAIYGLADQALETAHLTRGDIDAVAVTYAPGLIGAVLVGVNFAKAAALALGVPLVPVFIGRDKRLFHRVPIIIGKPYDPVYTGRKGTAEEYQSNAEEIMRRAYALGGIQWQR